jgi:hypothetical protein
LDAARGLVAADGGDSVLLSDLFVAVEDALPFEAWNRLKLLLRKHSIGGNTHTWRLCRVEKSDVIR